MSLSHLLHHDMERHRALLEQEAEQARLLRLARSETSHRLPRRFAFPYQVNIHLLWNQMMQRGRVKTPTAQNNIGSALSATCCCVCSH